MMDALNITSTWAPHPFKLHVRVLCWDHVIVLAICEQWGLLICSWFCAFVCVPFSNCACIFPHVGASVYCVCVFLPMSMHICIGVICTWISQVLQVEFNCWFAWCPSLMPVSWFVYALPELIVLCTAIRIYFVCVVVRFVVLALCFKMAVLANLMFCFFVGWHVRSSSSWSFHSLTRCRGNTCSPLSSFGWTWRAWMWCTLGTGEFHEMPTQQKVVLK